ncbi:MAG TPA: helix-turn-helix transcriptional regulator [Rubrivivax sp.]|nr:helix-turn-helix transcriptional regulator [Rubrivivax sp.]
MGRKQINQVVAEALRYYMGDRWNNSTLGRRAGVAANTIRNYLEPELRDKGASGKEPSAKLTELARLAEALGVEVADLVTDMTDEERRRVLRKRAADFYAEHGELPDWAPPAEPREGKRDGTHGWHQRCQLVDLRPAPHLQTLAAIPCSGGGDRPKLGHLLDGHDPPHAHVPERARSARGRAAPLGTRGMERGAGARRSEAAQWKALSCPHPRLQDLRQRAALRPGGTALMGIHLFPSGRSVDPGDGGGDDGGMEARVAKIEAIIPALATKVDLADLRAEMHREFTLQTWRIVGAMLTFGALLSTAVFFIARNVH